MPYTRLLDPEAIMFLIALASVLGSATLAVAGLAYAHKIYRQRIVDLKRARRSLKKHIDCVVTLLEDHECPDEIRTNISKMSECVLDRRLAENVVSGILKRESAHVENPEASKDTRLIDVITKLDKTRPDLVDTYFTAVAHGLVAMSLRWPKVRRALDSLLGHAPAPGSANTVCFMQSIPSNGPSRGLAHC